MKTATETDPGVPGGVYLCQVGEAVSCGACCGLYNVNPPDQAALAARLERRTDLFGATGRAPSDLDAFVRRIETLESQDRPFPDFHHCPYLGLVGAGRPRVGCLLHPLADGNNGIDLRGMSHYGGMACRVYFCRTMHDLDERYKRILRTVADDWYRFGMVVTETDLLAACLDLVEARKGAPLDPGEFTTNVAARKAMQNLLFLKLEWPFRPPAYNTPCHYPFDDHLYPRPMIDYAGLLVQPSPLDAVLFQLVSAFRDKRRLRQAEAMVEARIDGVIQALYQR